MFLCTYARRYSLSLKNQGSISLLFFAESAAAFHLLVPFYRERGMGKEGEERRYGKGGGGWGSLVTEGWGGPLFVQEWEGRARGVQKHSTAP